MDEHLLQYAFRTRRYDGLGLRTVTGEAVEVLQPGRLNPHDGPDFLDARVYIDGVEWRGAVELHLHSRGWYDHGHDRDPRYNTTVLHVVLESDGRPIRRVDRTQIPEVALAGRIDAPLVLAYSRLGHNPDALPCAALLPQAPSFVVRQWVQRLGAERILAKANRLAPLAETSVNDWTFVLWSALAQAFGGSANKAAFAQLAEALPVRVVQQTAMATDPELIEALLFGAASLLPDPPVDEYSFRLLTHWKYLQYAHKIRPLPPGQFVKKGLRPPNHAPIRLAQLAALLRVTPQLLPLLSAPLSILGLSVEPAAYWLRRYDFGAEGQPRSKTPGTDFINGLIINALVPVSVLYHRHRGSSTELQKALELVHELPAEVNHVTKKFMAAGFRPVDAVESQGLLDLNTQYCEPRKCLHCAIGHSLMRTGK